MTGRLLFDVSGLVQWYAFMRHPSGLQRVTENILGTALRRGDAGVECIARPPGSATFYRVDPSIVSGLVQAECRDRSIARLRRLFGDMMGQTPISQLLPALRSIHVPYMALGYSRTGAFWEAWSARQVPRLQTVARQISPPSSGDVLVGLGDFWCHRGHARALADLKQRTGCRLLHMVHDLFAADQPDWSHPHYGAEFIGQLEELIPHVDRWLVNSRFVAGSLERRLASTRPDMEIDVVPMGWDTPALSTVPPTAIDSDMLARFRCAGKPYVLHVGSVEPRKNLLALINAFQRLRQKHGVATPLCILVGHNGWKSDEIQARIREVNRAGEIVRWIRDANDRELAAFYRRALFTVVPSHAEGWGLAVQESLAHGTPCIASRSGGLSEAGLDLACYVDPDRPDELYEALARWIASPAEVATARQALKFRLGSGEQQATWASAADTVLAACARVKQQSSNPRRPGSRYDTVEDSATEAT